MLCTKSRSKIRIELDKKKLMNFRNEQVDGKPPAGWDRAVR